VSLGDRANRSPTLLSRAAIPVTTGGRRFREEPVAQAGTTSPSFSSFKIVDCVSGKTSGLSHHRERAPTASGTTAPI
jgi:hypothetical protein